uniref:leukocyte cell-derived chemotaxin-2-like n=1 Tax=Pristiophorus japonicus TaxID=55135 RepID=UPI00398F6C93
MLRDFFVIGIKHEVILANIQIAQSCMTTDRSRKQIAVKNQTSASTVNAIDSAIGRAAHGRAYPAVFGKPAAVQIRQRECIRLLRVGVVGEIIGTSIEPDEWGSICEGNLCNDVRELDKFGSGEYGASRGQRTHKGVDVICEDGATVYAPFSGKLVKRANPYGNGNAIDNGVQLEGASYCVKIFYVAPERYTGSILKGQKIGILLKMQSVYPGITSHVHIEMCNTSTDPTSHL